MEAAAASTENDNSLCSDEDLCFNESSQPISDLVPVRILKPEVLPREMAAEINSFAQLTCIPSGSIRIVLNFFKWDKEKILEKTLYGESFLLLRDMGIIVNPKSENGGQPGARAFPNPIWRRRLGDCLMCHGSRRSISLADTIITACGHWFCIRCFQQYLRSEVEIGDCSYFKCPYHLCRMFLDDYLVRAVIRAMPSPLFDAFRQLCVQDFVKCSKYRQICPTLGCNRSSHLDVDVHTKRIEVQCDCGATYCFGCGEAWHYPLNCEQLKKWVHKFYKIPEYSTVINIQQSKMPCPQCSMTVVHTAGKDEIFCSTCNFMFCWICLEKVKSWSDFHVCTSYLNFDIEPEILGVAAIQRDFEMMKEKFAACEDVDPDLRNLRGLKDETTSGNLTARICNIIVKSQQLLKYTYVFSYFLENTLMKYHLLKLLHKFENHLGTLMEEFEILNETAMTRLELEVKKERALILYTISNGMENYLFHLKQFKKPF